MSKFTLSNATILLQLANALPSDDLGTENLSTMPPALQKAIVSLKEEETAEAMKNAAKLILDVYSAVEDKKKKLVEQIRAARRMEAEAKAELYQLDHAKAYAEQSHNYLPLASMTGVIVTTSISEANLDKFVVPIDFSVKTKESSVKIKNSGFSGHFAPMRKPIKKPKS